MVKQATLREQAGLERQAGLNAITRGMNIKAGELYRAGGHGGAGHGGSDRLALGGRFRVMVRDKNGQIVKEAFSKNLVVNGGRQQVVNWLKHDLWTRFRYSKIGVGYISSMSLEGSHWTGNVNDIMDGNINTGVSNTDNGEYIKIDLGSEKALSRIRLHGYHTYNNSQCLSIEYSTNDSSYYQCVPSPGNFQTSYFGASRMPNSAQWTDYWFDTITARYIRIYNRQNATLYINEVEIDERNYLPQNPVCMALGTGSGAPAAGDTALDAESIRKICGASSQPSNYVARLVMSLGLAEGNSVTFAEAGLLYCDEAGTEPGTSDCDQLFCRGLFSPTWDKNNTQTADIYYEITVSSS